MDELRIPLTYTDKDGAVYTKTFVLKRNHYAVGVVTASTTKARTAGADPVRPAEADHRIA